MPEPTGAPALLHGWGGTTPTLAATAATDPATVGDLVRAAPARGVLARGLGRAYGDAAQNSGGLVLLPMSTSIEVAADRQSVTVSAGTSLHDLMGALLPFGLFLPVQPGTRQVSVGGAIAADVHGKNHYRAGSFCDHVLSLDLTGADGRTRVVTPAEDLFWATAGGMGLTGVVTRAVLRVRSIGSAYLRTLTERTPDLASLLVRMRAVTATREYAAAWVDLTARGSALGRGVLGSGDHAAADEVASSVGDPLAAPTAPRLSVPLTPPTSLVRRTTVRAFNEAWFRRAPARPVERLEHLSGFFHPLDTIDGWNRLYGPRGLVQYQLVVPDGAEDALDTAVRLISGSGAAPFLGVLKRMGPAGRGWLSFPLEGWSLAADFPASPRLVGLFRALDRLVVGAGGRVYLAKDSGCGPETLRAMYPRAEEFRTWREETGAARVFASDLSRRLRL